MFNELFSTATRYGTPTHTAEWLCSTQIRDHRLPKIEYWSWTSFRPHTSFRVLSDKV
jgi:hypothetical protein